MTDKRKFYQLTPQERRDELVHQQVLSTESARILTEQPALAEDVANHLIENQIGQFSLPLGVVNHISINHQDVIVPMVTEEPSVVAAANHAAKIFNQAGGVITHTSERLLTGQIIFTYSSTIANHLPLSSSDLAAIKTLAKEAHPSIVKRGGGLSHIETTIIEDENDTPSFVTFYVHVDVQEAMGANIINTILEGITPYLESKFKTQALMSILSNHNQHACTTAKVTLPFILLGQSDTEKGKDLAKKIVLATQYANLDPYRAVTHNKGIMNGVEAVVLASGNDTRAANASIHAHAAKNGRYQSLTKWQLGDEALEGEITLPLLLGAVGGAINVMPTAKVAQEIANVTHAYQWSEIAAAIGLAQNFAALRALVTDGIQKGHMRLHAQSLAITVGAKDNEIQQVAAQLTALKTYNQEQAKAILSELRNKS